jgi:hypothetical protein
MKNHHLVWDKHSFELLRNSGSPVRNMAVPYDKHELSEVAHPTLL